MRAHGRVQIGVTAQVVSCLVCDVPTKGVWGLPAPAGRRAEPYILFPGRDRAQRSEREPMPVLFFSHSNPMDKVHGGISIRFAVVLVCLPMLSPFHVGSPCGERESFQARILSSYKQRFIIPPCCPRSANNREGRKKGKNGGYSPPPPPTRNNVPGPDQFGSPHVRHDTSWGHPSCPKTSWAVTIKDSSPPCCPRSANNREGRMGAIRPQTPDQGIDWSQWAGRLG